VPLYRLFCEVTGYGGATQKARVLPGKVLGRTVTVRFNADTDPSLPWEFKPGQTAMPVRIGEQSLAFYTAKNLTKASVRGHATYNVVPHKAGQYFTKIDCFCFTDQTLAPGEAVNMPVSFFIDPALADDPDLKEIETITLSYTFFAVRK
jgi:cytochrome c oxidase assembly protein subunit 11